VARAFGLAQASGYGMFSILIMIALIVEGVPMHLLLRNWSHTGAWIFTGIGIYSFVWMGALYRSLALRPVLVGDETVVLQVGFLWRAEFRRDGIRTVKRFSPTDAPYFSLVVMNRPQLLIELIEPIVVGGPFGRRKAVTRIAVAVDEGDAFAAALSHSRES
jgi:hypothetical protein